MGNPNAQIHEDDLSLEVEASEDAAHIKLGTTADRADMWRLGKSQELRVCEKLLR